jgi:hypothetical protein
MWSGRSLENRCCNGWLGAYGLVMSDRPINAPRCLNGGTAPQAALFCPFPGRAPTNALPDCPFRFVRLRYVYDVSDAGAILWQQYCSTKSVAVGRRSVITVTARL